MGSGYFDRYTKAEPKCAFDADGNWAPENWDCQTLAIFRSHPFATESGSNDQTILVVPFDGAFVVLGFYKHRHRVETAIFISEEHHQPLNLALAEHLLASSKTGAP